MVEFPKTLHKKGGKFSTRVNGERVSFDVAIAIDSDDEKSLKKSGWCNGLDKALKQRAKPKSQAGEQTEADK